MLSHAKFHRTFRLDLTESQLDGEPFNNKQITSEPTPSQLRCHRNTYPRLTWVVER